MGFSLSGFYGSVHKNRQAEYAAEKVVHFVIPNEVKDLSLV